MKDILFALWFFLPAGLANAAPVFANKIPQTNWLAVPLDGGKHFRGKRITGDHKTVRGLLAGTLMGIVVFWLQIIAFNHSSWVRSISQSVNYSNLNPILCGAALGAGALLGDVIKSFFKRQFNISSGKTWFPFDQIDYIIGGLLACQIFVELSFGQIVMVGIVWFILHPVSTFIGWLIGLKDQPF
jgi:CDP-2,3-bis-(O-geranylgeranyl)-sn-glycerol synthase